MAFAILLTAVGSAQEPVTLFNGSPRGNPQGKIKVIAEPVGGPTSLDSLIKMSPLIVYGTVTSVLGSAHLGPDSSPLSVETCSLVAVDSILKGAVVGKFGIILLSQPGGNLDEWDVSVMDDLLVAEGKRYILFLMPDVDRKERPNTSGLPRYCVVGIWSGKAKVVDGKVSFLPGANAQLHKYDNFAFNAFLEVVDAKVNHTEILDRNLPIHPGGKKQ